MGRIMAIDYGRKRTGLAVTDELQLIATGLTTVETPKLMTYLDEYTRRESVDIFVVGEARQMDNTPSESARYIEPFVCALQKRFPNIPIERIDERFTSKMAFQSMIDSGLHKKQRQNKALIDTVSAVIILQSYMQKKEIENTRKQ
ncbi:MAG: Holliday junction resolvase RuvX [Bacteroidales bacterium]|nr:Holliday junction resolvase RuvX [Bacteroidales bacterium]